MPPPDEPTAPAAGTDAAARAHGRQMAQSLRQLLDRVPGAREVLPHLAALERALIKEGSAAIERVSEQGLKRMCSQLSSLPVPRDDPPLLDLLQRLMDALEHRRPPTFRATFNSVSQMMVSEATHSEFEAAAQEQAARAAPGPAQPR